MGTRRSVLLLAVSGAALVACVNAHSDGCFFARAPGSSQAARGRWIRPLEAEQTAMIWFQDGVEDLIVSPRFEGRADRFAWVIPVPSIPTVGKVDRALFSELADLTIRHGFGGGFAGGGRAFGNVGGVRVVERKQVGAYDVSVLQSGDARALVRWLIDNGYSMVPEAEAPAAECIRDGWTFVAARVTVPEAADGLQTGTLEPIRLTFRTHQPVYPMRMSRANQDKFEIQVYVVLPARAKGRNAISVDGPGSRFPFTRAPKWRGTPAKTSSPTLAGLVRGEVAIYVHSDVLAPQRCTRDLKFRGLADGERP